MAGSVLFFFCFFLGLIICYIQLLTYENICVFQSTHQYFVDNCLIKSGDFEFFNNSLLNATSMAMGIVFWAAELDVTQNRGHFFPPL